MSISRAFAFNPSLLSPPGATQFGNVCVETSGWTMNTGGLKWYNGPDENLGYVICHIDPIPKTAGSYSEIISGTSIGFWRTSSKTEPLFLELVATTTGQIFATGSEARTWLLNNGYWTSFLPPQPYLYLEEIATYLRGYMSDFRNPSFYNYQLDGNGTYINDGGGDMYDGGNYTTPWLLSGANYTSSGGSFPFSINYTNTTDTIVDTDFYYVSLGYTQFTGVQDPTYLPLTVIGSRKETGPIGWQAGGNSGADGGGTLASGEVWSGTVSNGFTTYAYYRQTYNAGDPSHCNLIILLGHPNWASEFGTINSFSDPTGNGGNGIYYYSTTASNVLAIHTLLSKNSGQQVTSQEIKNVVSNFTLRIKESLSY